MKYEPNTLAVLTANLVHHSDRKYTPYFFAKRATEICSLAKTVHKCDEKSCNGFTNDRDEATNARRAEKAIARAKELLLDMDLMLTTNRDPRGYPFIIHPYGAPQIELVRVG
jgi:hypothetical protein